jgi:hypothetical protein
MAIRKQEFIFKTFEIKTGMMLEAEAREETTIVSKKEDRVRMSRPQRKGASVACTKSKGDFGFRVKRKFWTGLTPRLLV